MKNNEAQREARKKDKLERELRQTKTDLDAKLGEIRDLQQKIEQYTAEKSKLENEKLVMRVIKKISVTFEPMCPMAHFPIFNLQQDHQNNQHISILVYIFRTNYATAFINLF